MLNLERMRFQIEVKITYSSLSILGEGDLASMIVFGSSSSHLLLGLKQIGFHCSHYQERLLHRQELTIVYQLVS
jgi:hypothetical protein